MAGTLLKHATATSREMKKKLTKKKNNRLIKLGFGYGCSARSKNGTQPTRARHRLCYVLYILYILYIVEHA